MLKDMKKEELETLSYNDIAYMLIKENKEMTTQELFKEIVKLLEMSASSFENKIGGFYTSITKDQRFLLLEDGKWDLKEKHKVSDLIDKDDIEEYEEDEEDNVEEEELEDDQFIDESTDDDPNEDLKDLVIVDEDELNEEE